MDHTIVLFPLHGSGLNLELCSTIQYHKLHLRHHTCLYLSSISSSHHSSFIRLCLLLLYIIRCVWDQISKLYLSSISLHHPSFIRLCLLLLYIIRCVWDTISRLYLSSISSLHRSSFIRMCLLLSYIIIIRCIWDVISYSIWWARGFTVYSLLSYIIRCSWDIILNYI